MKPTRHRVKGFFGGLLLGVGLALVLFVLGVLPLTVVWLAVIAVVVAVLGLVLASVVRPRAPQQGRATT